MSKMRINTVKRATQDPSTAPSVSKREQAALMTGAKVNIFLGSPGSAEMLFAVPRKLAAKYSAAWHRELVVENVGALYLQDCPKEAVKYLVEWMSAGGKQSTAKGSIPYPDNNLINLLYLNKLATYLEVIPLKEETLKSIDSFTRHQNMNLMLLDQVSKTAYWTPESLPIVRTNIKKLIGGRIEETWSAEVEEHPGRFKGALSLLEILGQEVTQEKKVRHKADVSYKKTADAALTTIGKTLANGPVGKGTGARHEGPNSMKESNKVGSGMMNGAGAKSKSMPRASTNATTGAIGQSSKAVKASIVCFNCGQTGHTRPYCSNPRVFLGKCHVCAKQGHRAVECPTNTVAKEEGTKDKMPKGGKNNVGQDTQNAGFAKNVKQVKNAFSHSKKGSTVGRANNTKQTQEGVLPPIVARIVFVNNAETSGKRTASKSTSATDSSSEHASRTSSKDTSCTSRESTPSPTKPAQKKGDSAKQGDQPAGSKDEPKYVGRFITKKVRALNISVDGTVQREMVPDDEAKEGSS